MVSYIISGQFKPKYLSSAWPFLSTTKALTKKFEITMCSFWLLFTTNLLLEVLYYLLYMECKKISNCTLKKMICALCKCYTAENCMNRPDINWINCQNVVFIFWTLFYNVNIVYINKPSKSWFVNPSKFLSTLFCFLLFTKIYQEVSEHFSPQHEHCVTSILGGNYKIIRQGLQNEDFPKSLWVWTKIYWPIH